jgi:hypothetical protein
MDWSRKLRDNETNHLAVGPPARSGALASGGSCLGWAFRGRDVPAPARQRWIRIGTIRHNWYVIHLNIGCPGGFFAYWAGRDYWCLQAEFLHWTGLLSVARHRLKMAGLHAIALASEWPRQQQKSYLWALVERQPKPKRWNRH